MKYNIELFIKAPLEPLKTTQTFSQAKFPISFLDFMAHIYYSYPWRKVGTETTSAASTDGSAT